MGDTTTLLAGNYRTLDCLIAFDVQETLFSKQDASYQPADRFAFIMDSSGDQTSPPCSRQTVE